MNLLFIVLGFYGTDDQIGPDCLFAFMPYLMCHLCTYE